MRNPLSPLGHERGAALVVAILMMALFLVIGISATTTSTIEVQIAANDKAHEMAFYRAEGGWRVAVGWLDALPRGATGGFGSNADKSLAGGAMFCEEKHGIPDMLPGGYTVDVTLNLPEHAVGYGSDFKRFGYEIVSTGSAPSGARSTILVTAGKVFHVGGY